MSPWSRELQEAELAGNNVIMTSVMTLSPRRVPVGLACEAGRSPWCREFVGVTGSIWQRMWYFCAKFLWIKGVFYHGLCVIIYAGRIVPCLHWYLIRVIGRMTSLEWFSVLFIFKVIWLWPWKSYPLCSIYSSWWILSIFGANDH